MELHVVMSGNRAQFGPVAILNEYAVNEMGQDHTEWMGVTHKTRTIGVALEILVAGDTSVHSNVDGAARRIHRASRLRVKHRARNAAICAMWTMLVRVAFQNKLCT